MDGKPTAVAVRDLRPGDVDAAEALLEDGLGGRLQARHGELIDVLDRPGLVAEANGALIGLITYDPQPAECELVALVATVRGSGIGSALVAALRERVPDRPIWVVTTNDNLDALRFYQRRGFRLRALRPGAVDEARRTVKPRIAVVGDHGIPLRDELELVLLPL
ncbi:MAG TPA: GNAT family N-acetyltransferase [Candidatus Limnocylindrales bacterium]|nr:GNAT family N-acetyltransferase [Candidatus Limnocylindrales bacterium]